jgi:GTPase
VEALRRRLLGDAEIEAVAVSALTGFGIHRLLAAIDGSLPFDPIVHARLRVPLGDGARIAMLHDLGRVLDIRYTGNSCEIEAEIPESLRRRLAVYITAP